MNKIRAWLQRSAVRQGLYVFLDQGMMSIGMFLVGLLVARAISKDEYGVYVLGWSFMSIVMGLHRAMVVLPFTVLSPKLDTAERGSYQSSGVVHTIGIGILAILFLAVWAAWPHETTQQARDRIVDTLPLLALITIPLLMREYLRSALFARLEFIAGAKVNTLASLLLVIVIVAAYATGSLSLESAYASIAATTAAAVVALMIRHPYEWPTMARIRSDLARNFRLGKWIGINVISFAVVSQVYVWLLLYLEGPSSVAAFGACLALSGLLAPLLRALNAIVTPKMAHSGDASGSTSGLLRLLRMSLMVIAAPYAAWLIITGLFSEQLMTFFYSDKYAGYGSLLFLVTLKTTIDSLSTPTSSALQVLERPDVTTVSLIIGAIVAAVLGYFLTKEMGLTGVGIAACIAAAVIAAWKWLALLRIVAQRRGV